MFVVPHALGQRVIVEAKALKDPATFEWVLRSGPCWLLLAATAVDLSGFVRRLNCILTWCRLAQDLLHRLAFDQPLHRSMEHRVQALVEFDFLPEDFHRNGYGRLMQSHYIGPIGRRLLGQSAFMCSVWPLLDRFHSDIQSLEISA